jgi:hypothetical protein
MNKSCRYNGGSAGIVDRHVTANTVFRMFIQLKVGIGYMKVTNTDLRYTRTVELIHAIYMLRLYYAYTHLLPYILLCVLFSDCLCVLPQELDIKLRCSLFNCNVLLNSKKY